MSKSIRTAILTYLIATPLLFTVFARLGAGPFGWPCRSGCLACGAAGGQGERSL